MPTHSLKSHQSRRTALQWLVVLGAGPGWHLEASAQAAPWPQRPVRLIVPNAPGSSVDTIGRLAANVKHFAGEFAGTANLLNRCF